MSYNLFITDTVGDVEAAKYGGTAKSKVPRYRRIGGEWKAVALEVYTDRSPPLHPSWSSVGPGRSPAYRGREYIWTGRGCSRGQEGGSVERQGDCK